MIVTRIGKGSPLSYSEADNNFVELDNRLSRWQMDNAEIQVREGESAAPILSPFLGGIYLWMFPGGQFSEAFVQWDVGMGYKANTDVYVGVHWSTATSHTGTVRWGFEFTYAKLHEQFISPPITVYIEDSGISGDPYYNHVTVNDPMLALPGSLVEPNTIIMAKFFRDGAHPNDTKDADVFVTSIDLYYQVDAVGKMYGNYPQYPPDHPLNTGM